MLIEERRQHILALIQKNGRVLVDELSSSLDLSKITIRKDLDYLESKDLLVRTHGGALPLHAGALSDPTLQEKKDLHHEEKKRIAKAAAAMVSEKQPSRTWLKPNQIGELAAYMCSDAASEMTGSSSLMRTVRPELCAAWPQPGKDFIKEATDLTE